MFVVFGAGGMLGRSILKQLSKFGSPEVYAPSHSEMPIQNELAITKKLKELNPRFVINCAAVRDVDQCEVIYDQALAVNSVAPGHIARVCKNLGSRFIHVSTDYVFDGNKPVGQGYTEEDVPNPIQAYGKTKYMGEQAALEYGAVIARVQWLYGKTNLNFVDWLVNCFKERKQIKLAEQYGSPSSVDFVAQMLLFMAVSKDEPKGVYHISHDDYCSRVENAQFVCDVVGGDRALISDEKVIDNRPAKRPMNTFLVNKKTAMFLKQTTLGGWKRDMEGYLAGRDIF